MTTTAKIDFTKITLADVTGSADKIIEAYQAGDVKIKNSIRSQVAKIKDARIDALDLPGATAAKNLGEALVTKITKPAVDVDLLAAQKIADLQATVAALIAEASPATCEHLAYGLVGNVQTKIAESATKISGDRAAGRNLQEAFDSLELAGTGKVLTVAQIMKETGLVSSGAISSRLFPKSGECTLDGVEPIETGEVYEDENGVEVTAKARSARFV